MRKAILRVFSLILTVIMIAGMGQQIFALDTGFGTVSANNAPASSVSPASIGNLEGLKQYLYNNIIICNTVIPISTYKIAYNTENVNTIFSVIQNDFPEFFHVDKLSLTYSGGYLEQVKLTYKMNRTDYEKAMTAVNEKAAYLIRGIEGSTLSDAEKVLLVHDRLAVYAEYDYPLSKEHAADTYTIYGTLKNGVAVCQGYAETFVFLMKKLGIQARTVSSDKLNHTWNIVTIGGKDYHVDVTWDDKTIDTYGKVYHDNLLRSTEGIKATGHNATDFTSSATDTKYDKFYWANSIAECQFFNGKLYFINNVDNTLRELTPGSTTSKVIVTLEKKWSKYYTTLANGNTTFCFSYLSSDKDYLYYTSPKSVIRFDVMTQSSETVYTPTLPGEDYKIFGFTAYNGKFYLDVFTTPALTTSARKDYGIIYPYSVTYTVVYDANGGAGAPENGVKEPDKTFKLSAIIPTRSGYTFKGWAEDSKTDTPTLFPNGNYTENRSIKLYAVWKANSYQVRFDANTGTCGVDVIAIFFDSEYGDLPVPTKENCDFMGWYTGLGEDGKLVTKTTIMKTAENHTLYARWKGTEYMITFDANEGTVTPSAKMVSYGSNVTLPTPNRVGYDFAGWYDENGALFENEAMYNYSRNVTLTAHWETAKYKITFDANGGTVSVTEKIITVGEKYGEMPTPTRNGYTFTGWYTAKTDGTLVTADTKHSIEAGVTLYAHWSGNKYTLYFNVDGTDPITVTCGQPIGNLPTPKGDKEGYVFSGWYIDGAKIDNNTVYKYTQNKLAEVKWQLSPELKVKGIDGSITVDYRATVTLFPEYKSIPEIKNAKVYWVINGDTENRQEGSKLIIYEIRKAYNVQCQLVLDGTVISQSPVVTINVKTGLFARLAAFFRAIFGRLPSYTIQAFNKMTGIR